MFRLGNFLFLLGSVLLVCCAVTIPLWRDFDAPLISKLLILLVGSAVMILVGQMMRFSAKRQERRTGLGFMDYYRQAGRKTSGGRRREKAVKSRCAFCGQDLTPSGIPARLDGVLDLSLSESHAGRCEECGKLVCPQCAFRKGMDMGIRSFRCPACGGRVV
jgi:DNA-directed RNA polymerase subunit RPC12/RpoP